MPLNRIPADLLKRIMTSKMPPDYERQPHSHGARLPSNDEISAILSGETLKRNVYDRFHAIMSEIYKNRSTFSNKAMNKYKIIADQLPNCIANYP